MTQFEKDTEVTDNDFRIAFNGLRITAKANGLDANTDDMREFLIQTANLIAFKSAETRALYNLMHNNMGIK